MIYNFYLYIFVKGILVVLGDVMFLFVVFFFWILSVNDRGWIDFNIFF